MPLRRRAVAIFGLWWLLLAGLLGAAIWVSGEPPVDMRSYAEGARAMALTGSPYPAPAEAQARWAAIHAAALGHFGLSDVSAAPVAGPYLYTPSLASVFGPGPGPSLALIAVLAATAAAVPLALLRAGGMRSGWWLLPAALSLDVLAPFAGGNAELAGLGLAFLACAWVWQGRGVWAAAPAAAALLLKPVFLPLFLGFALLAATRPAPVGPRAFRAALIAAALGGALAGAEVARWPAPAFADALAYLRDPMSLQYLANPTHLHWPMDLWNRAPLQVLVRAGLSPEAAQAAALALWAVALGACAAALRGRPAGPLPILALAAALALIARPVSWSLPWLDLMTALVLWPHLGPAGRWALGGALAVLGLSRWVAYGLFGAGLHPGLTTFQTPSLPFETLILLPAAVLGALCAARAPHPGAPTSGAPGFALPKPSGPA